MFDSSTNKKIRGGKLPKFDVRVERLCNLVGSIWPDPNEEIKNTEIDPLKHELFINNTRNCWSSYQSANIHGLGLNDQFFSGADLPHFSYPTKSSTAKNQIKEAVEDQRINEKSVK